VLHIYIYIYDISHLRVNRASRFTVRYAVNCRVGLCMCFVQRRVSRILTEGAGNTIMRFCETEMERFVQDNTS